MPNLQSFSMLRKLVYKYQSDYGLEKLGDAFDWVALQAILGLNTKEIDDAIVDDSMDGGIDAIYINGSDVHILTFTYTDDFNKTGHNFPQNKLDNLATTFRAIIEKRLGEEDVNPALWDKVQEIWHVFVRGPIGFYFHICSNKEKPDEGARKRLESELANFHIKDIAYWNLEDIVTLILQKQRQPVNGNLRFIHRSYFSKSDGPLKATVATIRAAELINLARDPEDSTKLNEYIFDDNIRVDLGIKNPVNQGIYESTLSDNNYEFWYLNNGITIVCDECLYTPNSDAPTATLRNVQIVNGGQTTRTLFHSYQSNAKKMEQVDVLVRIIETGEKSISERVSEAANRQTPVRTRDLHANDWIQKKLENEFEALGYFYERKRNQHAEEEVGKRLDAEEVGQVWLAYELDMPSEARDQKATIFGTKYDDIFDEEQITAEKLLFAFDLYRPLDKEKRLIQRKKRKKENVTDQEAFFSLATFHILNGMKVISKNQGLNLSLEDDYKSARARAIEIIGEVVEKERKERGEAYTHDRFFKQRDSNLKIRAHIEMALGDTSQLPG